MAKKKSKKKSDSSKKDSKSSSDLYMRFGLYGVLIVAVLVVLVVRADRGAKNQRAETINAWGKALETQEGLRQSTLAGHVVGSPRIGEIQDGNFEDNEAASHVVYTWKGIFSSFEAVVNLDRGGDDRSVTSVKPRD